MQYYLSLQVYLALIEKHSVDFAEAKVFIADLFNINVLNVAHLHMGLLSGIKDRVKGCFNDYRKYHNLLEIDDERIRYSTLKLVLDMDIEAARFMRSSSKQGNLDETSKIRMSLDGLDQLKALDQALIPELDDRHAELKEFAKFKTTEFQQQCADGIHKTYCQIDGYTFQWGALCQYINESMTAYAAFVRRDSSKFADSLRDLVCFPSFSSDDVLQMQSEAIKLRDSGYDLDQDSDTSQIEKHVSAFYFTLPRLERLCEELRVVRDKVKRLDTARQNYPKHKKHFTNAIQRRDKQLQMKIQASRCALVHLKKMALCENHLFIKKIEDMTIALTEIKNAAAQFSNEWFKNLGQLKDRDIGKLEAVHDNQEAIFNRLSIQIIKLNERIRTTRRAMQQEQKRREHNKQLLAIKRNLARKQGLDTFLSDRKKSLQAYKAKVAQARKEKEPAEAGSTTNTLTTSTIATEINRTFIKALLAELPRKQLELIQAIFNGEKGVRYAAVRNLIVNHLGGQVCENGGSHKRLVLNFEQGLIITSNSTEDSDQITASHRAVGIAVKPHGKAHASGVMSAYNVKQIKQFLVRAGFVESLVNELVDVPKVVLS